MSEQEEDLYVVPAEENRKISLWLIVPFILVILWGFYAFFAYWNGSAGWLDRGYWKNLQRAAHTTYPFDQKEPALNEREVVLPPVSDL